jgi:acyl-CoA thioester hydrolase
MTQPSGRIVSFRGVVYPAHCDAMGHMNVQYYTAVFDQAMWHLVFALGFHPSWVTDRREGWADVHYEIDFRHELHVGQLFHAESSVVKVGKASLVTLHRIVDAESREIAAEARITSVYFDLARRASRPLPDAIRSAAEQASNVVSATGPARPV